MTNRANQNWPNGEVIDLTLCDASNDRAGSEILSSASAYLYGLTVRDCLRSVNYEHSKLEQCFDTLQDACNILSRCARIIHEQEDRS